MSPDGGAALPGLARVPLWRIARPDPLPVVERVDEKLAFVILIRGRDDGDEVAVFLRGAARVGGRLWREDRRAGCLPEAADNDNSAGRQRSLDIDFDAEILSSSLPRSAYSIRIHRVHQAKDLRPAPVFGNVPREPIFGDVLVKLIRVLLNRARGRRDLCYRCGRFIGGAWQCRCGVRVLARGSLQGRSVDKRADP